MKRLVLSLSLLVSLGLQANDIGSNMKMMRDGLLEVQDGFLYNNKATVLSGIAKIETSNEMFHDKKSVETTLPTDKKKLVGVTLLSAQHLKTDLQSMNEYLAQGNMLEAASIYSDVIRDCTRCHAIVRGW
ncbi:MAG: hypothetical protein NTZ60_10170 [Campylobacterales bacterium]|nr:hypothetical protein [Campylobacterales bacterium]